MPSVRTGPLERAVELVKGSGWSGETAWVMGNGSRRWDSTKTTGEACSCCSPGAQVSEAAELSCKTALVDPGSDPRLPWGCGSGNKAGRS